MYGTPGLSMERSSSVAAALPYHSALTAPLSTPSASPGPGLQLNTVLRESGISCTSGARIREGPPPLHLPLTSGDPLTYSPTMYWSSRRCKRLLRSSFIFYHSQEKCQNVWQKTNFVSDVMGSAATVWDAEACQCGENLCSKIAWFLTLRIHI